MAWNKKLIAEGVLAPDLNDEIRDNWAALEAALTKEHLFSTGETPDTNQGHHRQGSARCYSQATAPGTRANGDAFTSADIGSLWVDSGDNKISILTATTPTWTPISTEIIVTLLAATRVFEEGITMKSGKTLTVEKLKAVDATGIVLASDGNATVIIIEDAGTALLADASHLNTSAAPALDKDIVNKKYVDDNVGSAQMKVDNVAGATFGAGSESVTLANGMIIKAGVGASVGANASKTITFGTAFPTAIMSVVVTKNGAKYSTAAGAQSISASSKTAFTYANGVAQAGTFNWIAIGC